MRVAFTALSVALRPQPSDEAAGLVTHDVTTRPREGPATIHRNDAEPPPRGRTRPAIHRHVSRGSLQSSPGSEGRGRHLHRLHYGK